MFQFAPMWDMGVQKYIISYLIVKQLLSFMDNENLRKMMLFLDNILNISKCERSLSE